MDLKDVIDTQILLLTQYLLENPSFNHNRTYKVETIIELPFPFSIDSQSLFALMSSAFSPDRQKQETFIAQFPVSKPFLETLGPNRQQYAIIVFDLLYKIDHLITGIVQNHVSTVVDPASIMKWYDQYPEYRIRKGIFLGCYDKLRARILIHDNDPKIHLLRYYNE